MPDQMETSKGVTQELRRLSEMSDEDVVILKHLLDEKRSVDPALDARCRRVAAIFAHTVDATDGDVCPVRLRDAIFSAERARCDLLLGLDRVCEFAAALRSRQPAAEADEVGRLVDLFFAELEKRHMLYSGPYRAALIEALNVVVRTALNRADNAEGGLGLLDEGGRK